MKYNATSFTKKIKQQKLKSDSRGTIEGIDIPWAKKLNFIPMILGPTQSNNESATPKV